MARCLLLKQGTTPPSGTLSIESNGFFSVKNYAFADVKVPASEVVQGAKIISSEGYHDVTEFKGAYIINDTENLSKFINFTGFYADTDGDGEADGFIFCDMAFGSDGAEGYLGPGVKVARRSPNQLGQYRLIGDNIIQKVSASTASRFYVVKFSNDPPFGSGYTWYKNAQGKISDWNTVTSTAFGAGKTNTETMLAKWDAEAYGAKDSEDIWSYIPDGCFIPSKDEWLVLGSELKKVSTGDYANIRTNAGVYYSFGDNQLWSSSLTGAHWATNTLFSNETTQGFTLSSHLQRVFVTTF